MSASLGHYAIPAGLPERRPGQQPGDQVARWENLKTLYPDASYWHVPGLGGYFHGRLQPSGAVVTHARLECVIDTLERRMPAAKRRRLAELA